MGMKFKKGLCMVIMACVMFNMAGCAKSATSISGLWLSDQTTKNGSRYGIYFESKTRVYIETVEEKGKNYMMAKAEPYQCKLSSDGIVLSAGSGAGEEDVAEDEERDGIPKLEYDGEVIKARGGDIDGMTFTYAAEKCEYTIDY